jgi:hypothetical protein
MFRNASLLKRRSLVVALLIALALAPLIVAIPRIVRGMDGACLASDFALLELSTEEATHGAQLLGPYSRFGWRHPGPAYFYLLAALYWISGGSSASLPVTVLIINWAAILGMAAALWRWADDWVPLGLALPLALAYGRYLGAGFVYNMWNPAITVLPLGVLLLACAAVACGRTAMAPVLVAIGSFLVQTHVGYLPWVTAAIAFAVVLWWRARGNSDSATEGRITTTIAAATLATFALLWAPPLIEQLTRTPGNLTLIARFFTQRTGEHGLGEALAIVAREIAWPWCYLLFGGRDLYSPYPALGGARLAVAAAIALAQTALLVFWSVRLRDRPFSCALARVSLVSTLIAVIAVMRIVGEVRPYFTTWISLVGLLGAVSAVAPLVSRWTTTRPEVRGAAALALVAELGLTVSLLGRPPVRDSQFPPARPVSDAVIAVLHQRGARRPQVNIQTGSPDLFFAASAIFLQMQKSGIAFAVNRPWWNFFGDRWRPNGTEDDVLAFKQRPMTVGPAPIVCTLTRDNAIELCIFAGR